MCKEVSVYVSACACVYIREHVEVCISNKYILNNNKKKKEKEKKDSNDCVYVQSH